MKITNGLCFDFSKFESNVIKCKDWHKMAPILFCEEQAAFAAVAVDVKMERQDEDLHLVINFNENRLRPLYYF